MITERLEKKHKRLSIKELRKYPGFENYSDEQAEDAIKTLETLSIFFFELFIREKHKKEKLTMIKNQNYETEQRFAA